MSAPTTALPRRRIKYTEQPFPSPNFVHSSPSVTLATRSGPSVTSGASSSPPANPATRRTSPRKLPAPVEISRRTGGRPSRPFFYKHDSARSVHPHTCDSLDCAMVKVMNTIEILEHVCTFLAPIHVLQLRLVNKEWHSLVVHSPQLSLHLFVEPQWSHPAIDFQLLLLAIPGLQIKRGDHVHLGQWVGVRMNLAAAKDILATAMKIKRSSLRPVPPILMLQPNYADLFITQPPLKGIQGFLVDAQDATSETANPEDQQITASMAHAKMSCDAGITLGFLAEVAQWMFEKHERLLQVESLGDKVVVFKAIVSYCVQSDAVPRMRSATRTVTEIESLQ